MSMACSTTSEKPIELRKGTYKTQLKNGMTVIISEIPSSSVVAVVARVKVGFFDEEDHESGLSHLLEHMYFKGTKKRPHPEAIAQETKAAGGSLNAWTYHEETVFHVTLPASRLGQAIDIHLDALTNPLIDAEQLKKETEVVLQEGKMRTDNPGTLAWEKLKNTAYTQHRVRRWLVGEDENLRKLTREHILKFHRNFYKPNNMILTISGGVTVDEAMEVVNRTYGKLESGEVKRNVGPAEPAQKEFRFLHMAGDIQKPLTYAAFPTVTKGHKDEIPLDMLSVILGGGKGSRLGLDLRKDRQWVTSISTGHSVNHQTGWFQLSYEHKDAKHFDDTMAGFFAHVQDIAKNGLKDGELDRAKSLTLKSWIGSWETPLEIAEALSQAEHDGQMDLHIQFRDVLKRIDPKDIQRVAGEYFSPERLTVVEYFPKKIDQPRSKSDYLKTLRSKLGRVEAKALVVTVKRPSQRYSGTDQKTDFNQLKPVVLSNGMEWIHLYDDRIPMVAVSLSVPGGRVLETEETAGWTQIMTDVLTRGPVGTDSSEFEIMLETLGTGFSGSAGSDSFGVQMYGMVDYWKEGLELLWDSLKNPAFAEKDVEAAQARQISAILSGEDNGFVSSFNLFRELAFSPHPYRLPRSGLMSAVKKATPKSLKSLYQSQMTMKGMKVVTAGDVATKDMKKVLESLPDLGLKGKSAVVPELVWAKPNSKERIRQSEKAQTSILTGFPGIARGGNLVSEQKLDLLAAMTGGLGGRFFARIRGEANLAYTVSAMNLVMPKGNAFIVYTATSPENERKATELLFHEIAQIKEKGFTDKEIADSKSYLLGQYRNQLDGMSSVAAEAMTQWELGRNPVGYKAYEKSLESITSRDLMETARQVFHEDSALFGILRGK